MRYLLLRDTRIPIGGTLARGIKGIIYICPHCGDALARAELHPLGTYIVACNSPCRAHGTGGKATPHIGGDVLNPLLWWDDGTPRGKADFLKSLSPELLRYSAEVKIDHLLKDQNG
jgi:hypothetical protein